MPETLLDLTAPRVITLQDRGRTFTITCRPVEKADWLAYFAALRVTSEQTAEGRISTNDYQTASLVLAERVIVTVEGYTVAGGGALVDLPGWQTRIPLAHRFQVGITLADAGASEQLDEFVIHPEGEEISLDAVWPGADGKMLRFNGLKHIFKTPTATHHKRYRDASSRSLAVGGSRTGRTVYLGAHATLCDLYDELILSVDGYAIGDQALTTDKPLILARMDAFHKLVAMKTLIDPSPTVIASIEAPAKASAE
jgi:hypothetical protein